MSNIIQNAAKITEGKKITYLISRHRHDFATYVFKNGSHISYDGGGAYYKRSGSGNYPANSKIEDISLTDTDEYPFYFEEVIVPNLLWGTRGKNGKQRLKYLPLISLTQSHLQAILDTQLQIKNTIHEKVIKYILDNKLFKK